MNRLPGRSLKREGNDWKVTGFSEINDELKLAAECPRIFSVESTLVRYKRLDPSNKNKKKKQKESFEVFASDTGSGEEMTTTYGFPTYLFSKSWSKSNGFAGSLRLPNGNISWFRLLVKMIRKREYDWHEMTFFIHQLDSLGSHVTVLCFEVPDDPVNDNLTKSVEPEFKTTPYNFLDELKSELTRLPAGTIPDWQYMQSLLLRQAIIVVDRGIWTCSKAVRDLEKSRLGTTPGSHNPFDFPSAHDLLRHLLHNTETLQVASQTLVLWLEQYKTDQKRQERLIHDRFQNHLVAQNLQDQIAPYDEDMHLPPECYVTDLTATLQLLSNLMHRSASNEARLRNEINLAFNVVNQQDTKAVRIISIVTLTFLPATFVSTLFSMSFFNYDQERERWKMSGWIWVYFVIAVPLTALTIAAWIWGAKLWKQLAGDEKNKES